MNTNRSQQWRGDQGHVTGHHTEIHKTQETHSWTGPTQVPRGKANLSVCAKLGLYFHSLSVMKQSLWHAWVSADKMSEARCRGRTTPGYATRVKGTNSPSLACLVGGDNCLRTLSKGIPSSEVPDHLSPSLALSFSPQVVLRSLGVKSILEVLSGAPQGARASHQPSESTPNRQESHLCSLRSVFSRLALRCHQLEDPALKP